MQIGHPQIGRYHRSAEIGLPLGLLADVVDPEAAAHQALAAVAADQIAAAQGLAAAATASRFSAVMPSPWSDHDTHCQPKRPTMFGSFADMIEHERCDLHLIAAQDRLRHLIGGRGIRHRALLLALGRHRDALQFPAVEAREVDDVGGMVRRQAQRGRPPKPSRR